MAATLDRNLWEGARRRVLERDQGVCAVGRFLGGDCFGDLHVHHVIPRNMGCDLYDSDNLATVCARHHVYWERLASGIRETRCRPRPNAAAYRQFKQAA